MLVSIALAAFQFDSYAQSRGGSRSSSASRSSSEAVRKSSPAARPDNSNRPKPDISPAERNQSGNRPSAGRPSGNKPLGNQPATRPSDRPKPSAGSVNRPAPKPAPNHKPGKHNKPAVVQRPASHPRPDRVHPRDRDFMHYSKPSYHWANNPHYYGYKVKVLPAHARRHLFGGVTYYIYGNVWYRPFDGHYVVCRPPFGISIAADLISGLAWTAITIARSQNTAQRAYGLADELGLVQSFASDSASYYYQDGVFYTLGYDGQYYVIAPPAGALVERLPEDFDMIVLNGKEYFKVDDTIYQMKIIEGKPYFEVLGQLN